MQRLLSKVSELILFFILAIFPFSYGNISGRWAVLISLVLIGSVACYFILRKNQPNTTFRVIFTAILFIIAFNFAEQVDFIQKFNLSIDIKYWIPLSTILLATGIIVFLVKIIVERRVMFINHPFMRYLLFSCALLLVFMILFYPLLWKTYQMKVDSDIQLINKIFKYLAIFILVMNYLIDESRYRRIVTGILLSFTASIALSILL